MTFLAFDLFFILALVLIAAVCIPVLGYKFYKEVIVSPGKEPTPAMAVRNKK